MNLLAGIGGRERSGGGCECGMAWLKPFCQHPATLLCHVQYFSHVSCVFCFKNSISRTQDVQQEEEEAEETRQETCRNFHSKEKAFKISCSGSLAKSYFWYRNMKRS